MATYSSVKQAVADAAGVGGSVTTYSTPANLPTSGNEAGDQAFVSSNNRLYIWNGSGWYNIALVNTNPSFSSSPDSAYALNTDGSSTTITLVATDPEGLDITYTTTTDAGFDGLATVSNDSSVFTITPRSEDSATTTSGNLTFKASDGVNLASTISQFTLTFITGIENSAHTAVLAKATGNAGTNTTFTDGSTNSHTITTVGNAHSSSFVPHHPGGYSAYLPTNTSYLRTNNGTDNSDFNIGGTGNWSYEAWVYVPTQTFPSYPRLIGLGPYYNDHSSFGIMAKDPDVSNYMTVYWTDGDGQSRKLSSTKVLEFDKWIHVAVCRSGNSIGLFYNGERIASNDSYTASLSGGNTYAFVGHTGNSTEGAVFYAKDVRFINGTHPYDASADTITVPTEQLTATTNTKLLACKLPYITDASASNHTITLNGNISIERYGPYDYISYSAASHGSSVSLDGSGDKLTIPADSELAADNGAFTFEAWIYPTAFTSYDMIASMGTHNSAFNYTLFVHNTSQHLMFEAGAGTWGSTTYTSSVDDGIVRLNQWQHIAVVYDSGNLTIYRNGKVALYQASASTAQGHTGTFALGDWMNTSSYPFTGYIAEARIVQSAVYSNNTAFTPPTAPLTAITNTGMLLTASPNVYNAAGLSNSIKLYGNTQSSTTQTKNASSSMYFDGSGDYAAIEDNPVFADTDVFTAECWVYPTGSPSQPIIFGQWTSPQSWGILLSNDSNRYARLIFHDGGYRDTTTSTQLTLNAWSHLALVKDGSTAKLYVNGSLAGTRTGLGTLTGGDNTLSIGANASGQYGFQGYIEDARFTPGLARYTDTFTPPTSELEG